MLCGNRNPLPRNPCFGVPQEHYLLLDCLSSCSFWTAKKAQVAATMAAVMPENHSCRVNRQDVIIATKMVFIMLVAAAGLWWLLMLGIKAPTKHI